MQELRFEDGTRFTVEVGEQVWLRPSIGGYELHINAVVGVPSITEAGKLLTLEAVLFTTVGPPVSRARLGRMVTNLAYTTVVGVHREMLVFPLTSLQVHAIEAARTGDISFEAEVNATLPQAAGYPGTAAVTYTVRIPKSTWEEQLAQVAPSTAFEMAVPYPLHDSRRAEPGLALRAAQRLITTGQIRGAIGEVRRALEWMRGNAGWQNPGKKAPSQCNQSERWSRILDALYSQTSGAMHLDEITKNFHYDRAEAETLLAMTAALLRNVPEQLPESAHEQAGAGPGAS